MYHLNLALRWIITGVLLATNSWALELIGPTGVSDCFRLHQFIQTKLTTESEEAFKTISEIQNTFLSQSLLEQVPIYGLVVSWGYQIRGENLFLPRAGLHIRDEGLQALVRFEKDDFPMDGNWDLIWKKEILFRINEPFIFESPIADKNFRIILIWERAPVNSCDPPPWLKPASWPKSARSTEASGNHTQH